MGVGIVKVGRFLPALVLLLAWGVDAPPAGAQSAAAADVDRFIGAWELVDWRATDASPAA